MQNLFVREIDCPHSPEQAHARLSAGGAASALLESARHSETLGRWSIAAARPFRTMVSRRGENPLPALGRALNAFRAEPDARVPFAGGAIGYLGYECASYLEPRRSVAHPEGEYPSLYFLFFDRAVVFDHVLHKTYLVLCAPRATAERSAQRSLDQLERCLNQKFGRVTRRRDASPSNGTAKRPPKRQDPFEFLIQTTLSRSAFIERVETIKDYISRGDIFQANLTHQIHFPAPADWRGTYARLKALNPSPFFGILDAGREQILSGSPERLLRFDGRRLDTRPIAGTRPRGATASDDRLLSRELLLSEKERAEHIMLVDLERNDLGRVCEPGSVRVGELMTLEEYSHVRHIVSNVEGELRGGLSRIDALAAFFPGGTITGAPKVRAMEIIRMLEPVPRGPYTGSLGYFSFSGGMDFNILIRSLFIRGARAFLGAGAGIVADSDPEREYDETLYKAEAVLHAACGPAAARRSLRSFGISRPRLSE